MTNYSLTAQKIKELALRCGFDLVGVASAEPTEDFRRFDEWRSQGKAGEMAYLLDGRGDLRNDPRNLLPAAKSIICVGKIYNTGHPYSNDARDKSRGWISRYAWGTDYHAVLRESLQRLLDEVAAIHGRPFESRICVDTAPLLERSYARDAGLGWVGKNTCLINQQKGSWFFLGELLLSIHLEFDFPAPERCGTCTRCIDACPTAAIVPNADGTWSIDSRLCISYLTIEKRGTIPKPDNTTTTNHLFGCDICQDVCPWNRRAPISGDDAFAPVEYAPSLERLAVLTEEEFRAVFRHSPVWRAKYAGFLRNVALAMGNSGLSEMREPLERLTEHPNEVVSGAASESLRRLNADIEKPEVCLCGCEGQVRSGCS